MAAWLATYALHQSVGPDEGNTHPQGADQRVGKDDRLGSRLQQEVGDLALAVVTQQLHQLGEEKGHLRAMSSSQQVTSMGRPSQALCDVQQVDTGFFDGEDAPCRKIHAYIECQAVSSDGRGLAVPYA